jgi:Putative zinc-finger
MTCEEFEAQLTAFSLGELDPDVAWQARAHVAHCDSCAASTLRDRQLTALLRASMVEMPPAGQAAVIAAVRSEAARTAVAPAARHARVHGGRVRRQASRGRGRHWLALATAAALAAVVLALTVALVPAPDRSSPISAGWKLYNQESAIPKGQPSRQTAQRLATVLGEAASPPDLRSFGLASTGWDGRMLAGHLALMAEYRDPQGRRVTLMRWRGELPRPTKGSPAPSSYEGMQIAQWGETASVWFKSGDVVSCLVGTVDEHTLGEVAQQLGA